MKYQNLIFFLALIILSIDFSYYPKFIHLINKINNPYNSIFKLFYWAIPFFYIIFLLIMLSNKKIMHESYTSVYLLSGIFILVYIPKLFALLFTLIDYFINLVGYLFAKFGSTPKIIYYGERISRSAFFTKIGILSAGILFSSLLWGILVGKTKVLLNVIKLKFKNLPQGFDGMKIVQISDIHLGSWERTVKNKEFFQELVNKINNLQPDLIVFTGDLVNNVAEEADYWIDILKNLQSKRGKYSILGNHDYGLYANWKNDEERKANMEHLYLKHKELGFRLLRNSSESITLGNNKIYLVGVENWGNSPFPQYGDYDKASQGIEPDEFKILLSHDPSYWADKIKQKNEELALTLSGHTHGMQFALNFKGKSWSPVQWRYKYWKGLYKENNKYLYVNLGLGFIAYPGRVGALPEVTIFQLNKEV